MGLSPISLSTSQIQSRMRLKFRHSDRFMFLNIRDYQETMKVFSLIRLQLAGAQGQTRTGTPKQKFLRLPSLPFHHLGINAFGCCAPPQQLHWQRFTASPICGLNLAKNLMIDGQCVVNQHHRESALIPGFQYYIITVPKYPRAGFITELEKAPFQDYCIIINYCNV